MNTGECIENLKGALTDFVAESASSKVREGKPTAITSLLKLAYGSSENLETEIKEEENGIAELRLKSVKEALSRSDSEQQTVSLETLIESTKD
jgi:hypothetical protein